MCSRRLELENNLITATVVDSRSAKRPTSRSRGVGSSSLNCGVGRRQKPYGGWGSSQTFTSNRFRLFRSPNPTHLSLRAPAILCAVNTPKIAPSILAADFSRLGEQVKAAEEAGADYIHIDVMDGHFVPNITIGPLIVQACKRVTKLPLDVHLMISDPERYLETFAEAGADILTLHAEATPHVHRALQVVRESGTRAGLAVNPVTPLEIVKEALPYLDLALVMSVNPGFGGQKFIEATIRRLRTVRGWIDEINPNCELEVDGGIDKSTAPRVANAGASVLVAGSAIFSGMDSVQENIAALKESVGITED